MRARADRRLGKAGDIRWALLSPEGEDGTFVCTFLSDINPFYFSGLNLSLSPKHWKGLQTHTTPVAEGALLICATSKRQRDWERLGETGRDRERQGGGTEREGTCVCRQIPVRPVASERDTRERKRGRACAHARPEGTSRILVLVLVLVIVLVIVLVLVFALV